MGDDEARLKVRSQIRGPLQNQDAAGTQLDSADDYLGNSGNCRMSFCYMRTCPNRTVDIVKDLGRYRTQKEAEMQHNPVSAS